MWEGCKPHGQKYIRSWRLNSTAFWDVPPFTVRISLELINITYGFMVISAVIPSLEARRNLMKLAQRMIRTFCVNMSTSSSQSWTALSDSPEDTVRITTRKITEPGQPNGVILSAVSTTWLPYSHYQVFDLLRDEHRRSQVGHLFVCIMCIPVLIFICKTSKFAGEYCN